MPRIVVDTNVLVAAIRSRRGASFKLLSLVDSGAFELALSVPLVLEYEEVLKRGARVAGLTHQDVDDILDYLCRVAHQQPIYFLWRPVLRDPHDDMVLEVAVESESKYIVTFNLRDFAGAQQFGVAVAEPRRFLDDIGGSHERD